MKPTLHNTSQLDARKLVELPGDWTQAIRQLLDLRNHDEVSQEQWEGIIGWLTSTSFDDETYMAGEVGYALVRDRAPPEIQALLQVESGAPPKCRLSFHRADTSARCMNNLEAIALAEKRLREAIATLEVAGVKISVDVQRPGELIVHLNAS